MLGEWESGGHLDQHGHDPVEQGFFLVVGRLVDEVQDAGSVEDGATLVGGAASNVVVAGPVVRAALAVARQPLPSAVSRCRQPSPSPSMQAVNVNGYHHGSRIGNGAEPGR